MAIEASIEQAAIRVADAFHHYAKEQCWVRESYRIFMTVRPESDTIHVTFLSDTFRVGEDEMLQRYDDVRDFLEQDLKDEPGLYGAIRLFLWPLSEFGFQPGGPGHMAEDEVLIPDSLLNPGVPDIRGEYWSKYWPGFR